jgi:GntR family transcriptional regulator
MRLSRVWQVRPRIAARGYQLIRGTRSSAHAANGFCLTAGTVTKSRDWEHSPAWRSQRKSVATQGHEIVLGHSWKGGMNTSIFQFAPWAGPAYLALADAIERAILAGSVQAGDRLPPQRMLADFLGLHVNTVNRAFRETRQRGLTSGNRRHGTLVLAPSLENSSDTLNSGIWQLTGIAT